MVLSNGSRALVLGGGAVGLSSAFRLAQAGLQVSLVDRCRSAGLECSYSNAAVRSFIVSIAVCLAIHLLHPINCIVDTISFLIGFREEFLVAENEYLGQGIVYCELSTYLPNFRRQKL